ncbi:hypothetical protein [Bradyrhizobium sp. 1(2017)]|uniref:hypothetical protein n=1 Tax=Bradyrhizobium sp. 1(2017) TaxID=1404888 RepID=UPI00140EE03C|nr:hypothetical protein [Bradyrhizobium sp. 1(2017)]QIO34337.1 hypothetical protein HAP40_22335 [Bradyrhizobium sp. 1(2017)]
MLIQITAPHFVAAYVVEDGKITEAAPILKWALGKSDNEMRGYCARKSWRACVVPPHPSPKNL